MNNAELINSNLVGSQVRLTKEILDRGRDSNNSFGPRQVSLFHKTFPEELDSLIGQTFPPEIISLFFELKNIHLQSPHQQKKTRNMSLGGLWLHNRKRKKKERQKKKK